MGFSELVKKEKEITGDQQEIRIQKPKVHSEVHEKITAMMVQKRSRDVARDNTHCHIPHGNYRCCDEDTVCSYDD